MRCVRGLHRRRDAVGDLLLVGEEIRHVEPWRDRHEEAVCPVERLQEERAVLQRADCHLCSLLGPSFAFLASRTITFTGFFLASKSSAAIDPTCPVTPAMTYIVQTSV